MTTITIERELLEQALSALDNSVDGVYEEYTEAVQRYANMPSRKARLDRLAAMAKAHLDSSNAIRAALAAPATEPEPVAWLRAGAGLYCGYQTCEFGDENGFPVYRHQTATAPSPDFWLNEDGQLSVTKKWAERNGEEGTTIPLYLHPPATAPAWQDAPIKEICGILDEVMDIAVKNGANSVSMPDKYVTVAAWLASIPEDKP